MPFHCDTGGKPISGLPGQCVATLARACWAQLGFERMFECRWPQVPLLSQLSSVSVRSRVTTTGTPPFGTGQPQWMHQLVTERDAAYVLSVIVGKAYGPEALGELSLANIC